MSTSRDHASHKDITAKTGEWSSVLGALIFMALLAPLFVLVYLLVRADGGTAFVYEHYARPDGQSFKTWKFRTRRALADDPRARTPTMDAAVGLTMLGAFLQRSRIDAIPSLYNVVKGDIDLAELFG